MYFWAKNTLKSNRYHTPKHPLYLLLYNYYIVSINDST